MSIVNDGSVEPFHTIKHAARILGVPYTRVLALVHLGEIQIYRFGNSKMRVRISEIVAYVERASKGDAK